MNSEKGRIDLNINAGLFPEKTLMFRAELASGKLEDGTPYEITQNMYGNGLLVRIKGKDTIHISLRDIMNTVIKILDDIPNSE